MIEWLWIYLHSDDGCGAAFVTLIRQKNRFLLGQDAKIACVIDIFGWYIA